MLLKTTNLCKTIKKKQILKDVTIEIPPKTIVGFIGPNGAGKTTTMKLCCGLASITSGDVSLDGISIKKDFESFMRHIGVSLSNNNFYRNLTAFENAKIFSALMNVPDSRIEETLSAVGLENRMDSKVGTFSLGMKQRLSIALSILHRPAVVLLDEPFNGIDQKGIQDLRSIIKTISDEYGTGFLISSHNLSELAKISSQNYYINSGVIVKHEMGAANKSIIDIKVDKPDEMQTLLETRKIEFLSDDSTFFIKLPNEDINNFFSMVISRNITICEFATGAYLEREYIDLMGDSSID